MIHTTYEYIHNNPKTIAITIIVILYVIILLSYLFSKKEEDSNDDWDGPDYFIGI